MNHFTDRVLSASIRLHSASFKDLQQAGRYLSGSDLAEMERVGPGRDPVKVITATYGDPSVMCISDGVGNVLAVGGNPESFIWFVHTEHAELLSPLCKLRVLRLLVKHLKTLKCEASQKKPEDAYHFTNIVSVENEAHIKLLNFMGAVWLPVRHCINGQEFKQFVF